MIQEMFGESDYWHPLRCRVLGHKLGVPRPWNDNYDLCLCRRRRCLFRRFIPPRPLYQGGETDETNR